MAFLSPHNLADKFEEAIYKVIGQPNADIPVFDVQDPEEKVKRLYRNHLLLLKEQEETSVVRPVPIPRNFVRLEKESNMREKETTHRRLIPKPRRQEKEIYEKQFVEESHIEEVRVEGKVKMRANLIWSVQLCTPERD